MTCMYGMYACPQFSPDSCPFDTRIGVSRLLHETSPLLPMRTLSSYAYPNRLQDSDQERTGTLPPRLG